MKSVDVTGITHGFKRLGQFFFAYNRMIYFVLFISALIGAIAGLNLALYQPTDDAYRSEKMSQAQSARFDTVTIEKIQSLNARQQTATDALPAGRNNPFGE